MTKRGRKRALPPPLPPRGDAVGHREFLATFDFDCGELVPGHRFIARGISRCRIPGPDENERDDGQMTGIGFEYELVPGVPAHPGRELFAYLVSIRYEADVDLPWGPADGGAIAPFEGGSSTHGSLGDWPLPDDARLLTFTLFGVDPETRRSSYSNPAGRVIVDLVTKRAEWQPAPIDVD
jgi:hypothetical protein